MRIRKDMIFAVLTTFCLSALMFTVIPIRSGLPYDPWADIDDNGKIDMKDIGNVAAQFMASGDPTKNVNVTNWMPSQPKLVWCGDYLSSNEGIQLTSGPGIIHVADFERMTVFLDFSDMHWQTGWLSYMSAFASWYSSGDMYNTADRLKDDPLPSTLYQIEGDTVYGASITRISTDSYPIKAPYLMAFPFDESHTPTPGNVTISVYVYLSNEVATGSLHKTMSWRHLAQGNTTFQRFGLYTLTGFSQLNLQLQANVTLTVSLVSWGWGYTVDSFTFTGTISKTYALVYGDNYVLDVTLSVAKPWSLSCVFYVTT